MALKWSDFIEHPEPLEPPTNVRPQYMATSDRRVQVHCLCGRFAKWAGDRHYYNGNFDCYSYDTDCSRCGIVTVECV